MFMRQADTFKHSEDFEIVLRGSKHARFGESPVCLAGVVKLGCYGERRMYIAESSQNIGTSKDFLTVT